jgi:DNA repair exonuclease SbcCD ATPase subunit
LFKGKSLTLHAQYEKYKKINTLTMNFNNALKKVLGLGDFGEGVDDLDYFEKRNYDNPWRKDEDEKKPRSAQKREDGNDEEQGQEPVEKPVYTRVELPRQQVDMSELAVTKDVGVPENILKRIMIIINGNLPTQILNNLNVEAETQAIVETLRPQFRDYETRLRKDVLDSAAEKWNKERAEIIDKLKETDDKALNAYEEIEDLKEKIKSTENSRKSTLTRYNDLQMKMQELMTSKEKVEMENRSLQNKMKVLQMNEEQNKSGDIAKEELLKLNQELTKERNEGLKSKERITQLQKQIDELRASGDAAPVAAVVDTKALEEKDAEIDTLAAQVAWLHRRLDETSEELDKANEDLAQAEQLVAEIEKFEEIKQRKDDEIAILKKKLLEAGGDNSEVEELKAQIEELKEQLKNAANGDSPILDDLDDGINFTGDDDQMSLFK